MEIILLFILLYGLIALMVSIHLRVRFEKKPNTTPVKGISIIIPFRNEEHRIRQTIQSLNRLHWPDCPVEVLFIDDDSTDKTIEVIQSDLVISCSWKIIKNHPHPVQKGKAAAIITGIKESGYDWLIITDADMSLKEDWLLSFREAMALGNDMICSASLAQPIGFLGSIQQVETSFLMALASGLHASGFPVSAIGNNMAFKKGKYRKSGGLEELPATRREDFELYHLFIQHQLNVNWNIHPSLTAFTDPVVSLKEWIQQKRRWFGFPVRIPIKTGALIIFFWFYLVLMVYHLFTLQISGWILLLAGKIIADWLILKAFQSQSGHRTGSFSLLRFELVYQFLLFLLPLSGIFAPVVSWKGRKI